VRRSIAADGRSRRGALAGLVVGVSISCAALVLALAGAAGAQPDARSQVAVRLTGEIDVRANLTRDGMSLTFTAHATFDVTLTTDREHLEVVPLTYDWTGTSGSCRWSGSGSDGELTLQLDTLVAGRPGLSINGKTPSAECNRYHTGPIFGLVNVKETGVIAPQVYWGAPEGSLEGRGTATLSYECVGCATPPGARYDVRAMHGRRIEFKPREPRAGQLVSMSENVVVLEKSSTDTHWTVVRSNVTAKCRIYLRSGRKLRTTLVPGRWRTPAETGGDGVVACAPWRIPRSTRPGSLLGFTPIVTYRGQTLTTTRSFWTRVSR
jgi:hypothetical protein